MFFMRDQMQKYIPCITIQSCEKNLLELERHALLCTIREEQDLWNLPIVKLGHLFLLENEEQLIFIEV